MLDMATMMVLLRIENRGILYKAEDISSEVLFGAGDYSNIAFITRHAYGIPQSLPGPTDIILKIEIGVVVCFVDVAVSVVRW